MPLFQLPPVQNWKRLEEEHALPTSSRVGRVGSSDHSGRAVEV